MPNKQKYNFWLKEESEKLSNNSLLQYLQITEMDQKN